MDERLQLLLEAALRFVAGFLNALEFFRERLDHQADFLVGGFDEGVVVVGDRLVCHDLELVAQNLFNVGAFC